MGRRLRIVPISGQCLVNTCKLGYKYEVMQGLPEGANLVGAQYNLDRDCFELMIEHPSFDVVPDGDQVPRNDDIVMHVIQFTEYVKEE